MLRSCYTLNIHRIREITEIFIGLANTIMLRMVTILNISHAPCIIANQLECTAAFTHFVSLEADEIILYWCAPTMSKILTCSGKDATMSTLFLDKHVIKPILRKLISASIVAYPQSKRILGVVNFVKLLSA